MRALGIFFLGCSILVSFASSDDSTDMQTEDMLEDTLFKILSAAEKEKQQEISKRVEDILDDLTELAGEEDALDLRAAGDAETSTVTEEEADATGEVADDGLIIKKGCGDHQEGEKWGTPEHDNCLCAGPDSFCDHVDCPSGSEITRDSNGLWECPGGSSTDDSDEKRAQVDMLEDRLIQILEEEDALDLRVADGVETPTVRGAEENATVDKGEVGIDSRGLADGRLIKKGTGTCPSGYHQNNGKCYRACLFRKTWHEASAYCRSLGQGGNLAMPKDHSTNNFLIQLKNARCKSGGFWFGLNDKYREGQWKWVDGSSLGWYKYWGPGEPNNVHGGEDCAEYFPHYWRNSKWNDARCNEKRYFICERAPNGGGSYRADYRCGSRYPAGNGYAAACNANGPSPCCSRWDWCGGSAAHCNCAGCVDYRKRDFRNDFRCGQGFPAGNGRPAKCNPSGPSPCCSRWKWCGSSSLHCNCHGCVDYRKYG
ncbi:uncharacterized protein [Branchiostoma lanceolatum]|uniref:uncharacterized protein n=1 Tax=Branchiostoma lanceolatum TaxID=7740 RepID=UPI003456030E